MSAVMTSYDVGVTQSPRQGQLRRMIAGAAAFDAAVGVFALAAAGPIGGWLSLTAGSVRITGGVFLAAAVTGAATLLRRQFDVRWIATANLIFAAWCLALFGLDTPNAVGVGLLLVSALASGSTAAGEQLLARR